ncbi:Tethering factor for nuclear proteasome sts1 [Rhizina undulata]
MSALINPQPFPFPPHSARLSPPRLGGKKRKADEDEDASHYRTERSGSYDDSSVGDDQQMSTSPSHSPNMLNRQLGNTFRVSKKHRSNVSGRPLPLSRLLETVDTNDLKNILRTICDRHPELTGEISSYIPRPTVGSALSTLQNYESAVRAAFPYGPNHTGDYAYNRVRPPLMELLDALSDYTPNFLPPNEPQTSTSLAFLDEATNIIHRLPNWDNPLHNHSKQMAYEEITKAWILVVQEAAKRGAGIGLHSGGWDTKLAKHVEQSEGKMQAALTQMRQALGWMGEGGNNGRNQRLGGLVFNMHSPQVSVRSW